MEQNAAEGKPHGGSTRPFGYGDDTITVRPEEAGDRTGRWWPGSWPGSPPARWRPGSTTSEVPTVTGAAVAHHHAEGDADQPPLRRTARPPGRGRRPSGVGADHHRGRAPPRPGQVRRRRRTAADARPSATCSRGCCAAASAATGCTPAPATRTASHPPLRLPVRTRPRRLRRTHRHRRPAGAARAPTPCSTGSTPPTWPTPSPADPAPTSATQELTRALDEANEQLEELAAPTPTATSPCASG